MSKHRKRLGVAAALAMTAAFVATAGSAQAAPVPGCVPANNLEAIIDDSGSMNSTDGNRYRADLVDILATFNPDKTMGGVQFGSDASQLFPPLPIGANLATIRGSLNLIQADDLATNYEAGFTLANSQNPNADTRIFLSDGAPNEPDDTPDPAVWTIPRIKAYVVGFGSADPAILSQIAADTGGPTPFSITNSSELRTVAMFINARLNCETDPILFTDKFSRKGQVRGHSFKPSGNSAELLTSWPDEGVKLAAISITQGGGAGKSLASLAKKKKKKGGRVKVKRSGGTTYVAVTMSKLKKGKRVRFKIKAKRLFGSTTATTAVIP